MLFGILFFSLIASLNFLSAVSCSSDCGDGFFNNCDREECESIDATGGCYYEYNFWDWNRFRFFNSCNSCTGKTSCTIYKDDELSCEADACDIVAGGDCVWNSETELCENPVGPAPPVCGNGVPEGIEECDDHNTANNDGCSASCETETTEPAETCTDTIRNQDETGTDCGGVCPACETPTPPPNPPVSEENLVLYIPFDTNANDYSEYANNGILKGNAKIISVGKVSGALELDGNGDYVEVERSDSLNIQDEITISAWVYPTAQTTYESSIVSKQSIASTSNGGYYLYEYGTIGGFDLENTDPYTSVRLSTDSGTIPIGNFGSYQWTNIVGVYDGEIASIYINGELVETGEDLYDNDGKIGTNFANLLIGYYSTYTAGMHTSYYKGRIDEVKVYNIALTEEEIAELYEIDISTETHCNDGVDDDDDGDADCEDADCEDDPACTSLPITYQCDDEVDNDGDGLTDYPDDSGCTSATDNDETDSTPACAISPNPIASQICSGLTICGIAGTANCAGVTCPTTPTAADVCLGITIPVNNAEDIICRIVIGTKTGCSTCGTLPLASTVPCNEIRFAHDTVLTSVICGSIRGTKDCGGSPPSPAEIDSCNDFDDKTSCDNWDNDEDIVETIYETIESRSKYNIEEGACSDEDSGVSCYCEWRGNVCKEIVGWGGIGGLECETSVDEALGDCDSGEEYVINWVVDGTAADAGEDWCQPGTKTYRCPSKTNIPFFTFSNFIISVLAVAVIYFLMKRRK